MLEVLIIFIVGTSITFATEYFHNQHKLSTESARKVIHMLHGVILIALAFMVSYRLIIIAELIFLVMAIIARKLKLFKSQYSIDRTSWGEVFFPIGVVILLALNTPRWIFIIAMLNLAFADSIAAVLGTKYGKKTGYTIFGQEKSIIGSLAFFSVSCLIMVAYLIFLPSATHSLSPQTVIILPFAVTIVENLGLYGSDNLFIPLAIALLLGL